MAYTVSIVKKYSEGNVRVHQLEVTADAAEDNVDTGLTYIDAFNVGYKSMTALAQVFQNVDSSGTASNGKLGCSGFTSGDELFFTVYGR